MVSARLGIPPFGGLLKQPLNHSTPPDRKLPAFYRDIYFWLTVLLSLPVVGPLLQPGYFWGAHDARHSVYFLHQFNLAIQEGILYPRWAPDFAFGYGYPFFNIYGPLSSYSGQFFHLFGLDIVTSVKTVFGLSAILSGVTMYLFVSRLLGRPSGIVAALTYVYIPYHLFDIYVRAALAESVGFVFIPLVWWGFYETVTRPNLRTILWTGVAYAALMFTSNLLALIFTPLLGLYVAYMMVLRFFVEIVQSAEHRILSQTAFFFVMRTGIPSALALFVGLSLSAIFWLPAFTEYQFVRVDQWIGGRFAFGDDFVEIFQLFSPQWGFGASIPGPDDEAGFQIGLAATILYVLSFLGVARLSSRPLRQTVFFFQGLTLVVIFLTVPISNVVWTILPLSSFAQFPWRLLVVVAPIISVCTGVVAVGLDQADHHKNQKNLGEGRPALPLIVLISLILLSSYPYMQAEVRDPKPTEGPVSQTALFRFQQSSDEMTGQTAWVRRIPNWSTLAEQVKAGGTITTKVNYTALPEDDSVGVFSMEMESTRELLWVGTEQEGQAVTFFIPYYPGWQAYIYEDLGPNDGNLDKNVGPVTRIGDIVARPNIQTTQAEGWMVVPIPTGSHFLELRFEDTMIRIVGQWLSMISFIFVIGLLILTYRQWGGLTP